MAQTENEFDDRFRIRMLMRIIEKSNLSKYVYSLLSIGFAGSLIVSYNSSIKYAILVSAVSIIGIIIIIILERILKSKSLVVSMAAFFLLFCVTIFLATFLFFTVSAFAFNWPSHWVKFIGLNNDETQVSSVSLTDEEERNQKYISKWYCDVLSGNFDFQEAVKSFKLEKLIIRPQTIKDRDSSTSVNQVAEGEDYNIYFKYLVSKKDSHKYGFTLSLEESLSSSVGMFDSDAKKYLWLTRFGSPEKIPIIDGYEVGVGKVSEYSDGYGFSFSYWNTIDGVMADWFAPDQNKLSRRLCGVKL